MSHVPSWSSVDVLVLAAHAPDLRGLRPLLGDHLAAPVGPLRVAAKAVGVGLATAGPSASKRIYQLEPRAVLFVGTAGAYPSVQGYSPHDVAIANRARLIDLATLAGFAELPPPVLTELSLDRALGDAVSRCSPHARIASVASPLAATRSDEYASIVPARTGAELENLELFAVANACKLANVPLAAFFGVSHVCGSTATTDWPKFERQAAIAAAEAAARWIQSGAPAIPDRPTSGAPR